METKYTIYFRAAAHPSGINIMREFTWPSQYQPEIASTSQGAAYHLSQTSVALSLAQT